MPQDPKKRKAQKVLDNLGDTNLAHLEATLELGDRLEEIRNAVENIPKVEIPEYPEMPEIPKTDLTEVTNALNTLVEETKKPCTITLNLILK